MIRFFRIMILFHRLYFSPCSNSLGVQSAQYSALIDRLRDDYNTNRVRRLIFTENSIAIDQIRDEHWRK